LNSYVIQHSKKKTIKLELGFSLRKANQGVSWWLAVKDLVLSLLWSGFNPWPSNFCMPWARPEKKKKKKKRERIQNFTDFSGIFIIEKAICVFAYNILNKNHLLIRKLRQGTAHIKQNIYLLKNVCIKINGTCHQMAQNLWKKVQIIKVA